MKPQDAPKPCYSNRFCALGCRCGKGTQRAANGGDDVNILGDDLEQETDR